MTKALEAGTVLSRRYTVTQQLTDAEGERLYRATASWGETVLVTEFVGPVEGPEVARARMAYLREVKVLTRVQHPGVIRTTDLFEERGTVYLIQEDRRWVSLRDQLSSGPLKPEVVLKVATEAYRALAAAHAGPVLHRRLSPERIWTEPGGAVTLARFGLGVAALTEVHQRFTPDSRYTAPEQLAQDASAATYSDLYSLAAVLVEALTGRTVPPASARAVGVPLPPFPDDTPPALREALRRALKLDPAERTITATASEVAELLLTLDTVRRTAKSTQIHEAEHPAVDPSSPTLPLPTLRPPAVLSLQPGTRSVIPGNLGDNMNRLLLPGEKIIKEMITTPGTGVAISDSRVMFAYAGFLSSGSTSLACSFDDILEIRFIPNRIALVSLTFLRISSPKFVLINVSSDASTRNQLFGLIDAVVTSAPHIKFANGDMSKIVSGSSATTDLLQNTLSVESSNQSIVGCTVLGGYGHNILPGSNVIIAQDEIITIYSKTGTKYLEFRIDDIIDVVIGGPGETTTGGGFTGGGYGFAGAVKGIVASSLLNALTTRTIITTTIQINLVSSEILIVNNEMTPTAVRVAMSPILGRIKSRNANIPPDMTSTTDTIPKKDLATQIRELAHLHEIGALDDDEFKAAKTKILSH